MEMRSRPPVTEAVGPRRGVRRLRPAPLPDDLPTELLASGTSR